MGKVFLVAFLFKLGTGRYCFLFGSFFVFLRFGLKVIFCREIRAIFLREGGGVAGGGIIMIIVTMIFDNNSDSLCLSCVGVTLEVFCVSVFSFYGNFRTWGFYFFEA